MGSELIPVRTWIEKHSFDQADTFGYLAGKTLDGVTIKSVNTKVSEAALNSYINYVRAAQRRKPINKGIIPRKPSLITLKKTGKFTKPVVQEKPQQLVSQMIESKKVVFTANVAKIVDPAVLARIQSQQEAKLRAMPRKPSLILKKIDKPVTQKSIVQEKPQQSAQQIIEPKKHCIKCNEELDNDALFCSECGVNQNEMLPIENDDIRNKFIEAAKQSKRDDEGYILMNEFSLTLKDMNVKWEGGFKNFLKNYSDIIEFKPDTPTHAQAIRVKGVLGSNSIDSPKKSTEINKPIEAGKPTEVDILEKVLNDADKIYMDTCALMENPWEKFFEKANPILKKHNKKVIILTAVVAELRRNAENSDSEMQSKVENALKVLIAKDEITVIGEEGDDERIADQAFKVTFEKYRHRHKMLLISQDHNLSKEILNLNNSEALRGKKCMVCKIDDEGYLKHFESHKPEQS